MSDLLADIDKQILTEFAAEISDLIDAIEPDIALAKALDNGLAKRVFRCFNTLREVSVTFGFSFIATLSTSAESYLQWILGNEKEIRKRGKDDKMILETFLKTFDLIKEIVKIIALQKSDSGFEHQVDFIQSSFKQAMNGLRAQQREAAEKGLAIKVELTDDLIEAFKAESSETLANVEQMLLALCSDETNSAALDEAFRCIHSFKGNCGIFGLVDAQRLSHMMESCLGRVRDGSSEHKQEIFGRALNGIDLLKQSAAQLDGESRGAIADVDQYIIALEVFLSDAKDNSEVSKDHSHKAPDEHANAVHDEVIQDVSHEIGEPGDDGVKIDDMSEGRLIGGGKGKEPPKPAAVKAGTMAASHQDIRVAIQKLDMINNLAGELVTAKTMLLTNLAELHLEKNEALEKSIGFLTKTINDLRDVSVEIRMTPVQSVFKKMVRIIHDLSQRTDKLVAVEFVGEDTEVDKTIIEKIGDPIAHMVRNAIDHGLETVQQRRAVGKSDEGRLRLAARHEGGMVWIIVEDDGKGLDRQKILQKAIALGLVEGDGGHLRDQEVYKLIFHAGFSTADELTDISGRGVGMDVVLQNVRDLRGVIDIETTQGKGTRFILKLPLTLAIMDGMLFEVAGVKYILPVDEIREIVKLSPNDQINISDQQKCIDIRGRVMPVVSLGDIYNLGSHGSPHEEGLLMVIGSGSKQVALLVDKIIGQHQTVVKPLSGYFQKRGGIKSCSILGNGEVSLILESTQLSAVAA